MNSIALEAIRIAENRQRREFPAAYINELAESIQNNGLFHPIILRMAEGQHTLVAGECRLRAITQIYDLGGSFRHDGHEVFEGCVPYVMLGDLDSIAAEEAELEENIRRKDLTWAERAAATARIAALRARQAEQRGDPLPTVADVALEIRGSAEGIHHDTVRKELAVSRHLDDPDVKSAKNLDDAFKVLKKKEEVKKNVELAERVGRIFSADFHRLHNADSREWLRECPAATYDVILTDPPYGMGADEFGDSGGKAEGAHGYRDDAETFESLMSVFIPHSVRVTKPEAHLYLFCDIERFFWLREELSLVGWEVFRTPLIWYKKAAFRAPWPDGGPQRKYEMILYARKGKKNAQKLGGDVLEFPADENQGHAAQKPVALLSELLSRSVRPGDSVLDPFCGSGSSIIAAHGFKCRGVGVEIDPGAYGIAAKRVQMLKEAA